MLNRVKIVAVAGAVIILLATVVVWATAGCDGDDPATAPVVEQIVTSTQQPRQPAEQHTEAPVVTESAEAVREATTDPGQDEDKPVIVVVQREEVQPVDQQQEVAHGLFMEDIYRIPATLEEMVIKADIIARVRLLSVKPAAVRSDPIYSYDRSPPEGLYIGGLVYRLDVLEYLKGNSASTTITAFAYGQATIGDFYATTTVAGAKQLGRALLAIRDNRWEGREGIIFLRQFAPEERYVLDYFDLDRPPRASNVSVSDNDFKAWLPSVNDPATSTDRIRTASGGEQLYFVEDPYDVRVTTSGGAGGVRSASGGSRTIRLSPGRVTDELGALNSGGSGNSTDGYGRASADSSIVVLPPETETLSGIKSVIAESDRQLRASGNSEEAKRCLAETWWIRENGRFRPYDSYAPTIGSRQVTGGFYINRYLNPELRQRLEGTPRRASSWFRGPDAHRFEYVFPGRVLPVRPLPAGQYSIFYNELGYNWAACDFYPEEWRDTEEYPITVTSPAGTLDESFFDPYASSTAITGTTTVGTISWQAGRVTADLDIDATGHALDFIGLDGTTTVSLLTADATETGGALTWTVPTQPWSPGDKLMLRIRRVTPQ